MGLAVSGVDRQTRSVPSRRVGVGRQLDYFALLAMTLFYRVQLPQRILSAVQ